MVSLLHGQVEKKQPTRAQCLSNRAEHFTKLTGPYMGKAVKGRDYGLKLFRKSRVKSKLPCIRQHEFSLRRSHFRDLQHCLRRIHASDPVPKLRQAFRNMSGTAAEVKNVAARSNI